MKQFKIWIIISIDTILNQLQPLFDSQSDISFTQFDTSFIYSTRLKRLYPRISMNDSVYQPIAQTEYEKFNISLQEEKIYHTYLQIVWRHKISNEIKCETLEQFSNPREDNDHSMLQMTQFKAIINNIHNMNKLSAKFLSVFGSCDNQFIFGLKMKSHDRDFGNRTQNLLSSPFLIPTTMNNRFDLLMHTSLFFDQQQQNTIQDIKSNSCVTFTWRIIKYLNNQKSDNKLEDMFNAIELDNKNIENNYQQGHSLAQIQNNIKVVKKNKNKLNNKWSIFGDYKQKYNSLSDFKQQIEKNFSLTKNVIEYPINQNINTNFKKIDYSLIGLKHNDLLNDNINWTIHTGYIFPNMSSFYKYELIQPSRMKLKSINLNIDKEIDQKINIDLNYQNRQLKFLSHKSLSPLELNMMQKVLIKEKISSNFQSRGNFDIQDYEQQNIINQNIFAVKLDGEKQTEFSQDSLHLIIIDFARNYFGFLSKNMFEYENWNYESKLSILEDDQRLIIGDLLKIYHSCENFIVNMFVQKNVNRNNNVENFEFINYKKIDDFETNYNYNINQILSKYVFQQQNNEDLIFDSFIDLIQQVSEQQKQN